MKLIGIFRTDLCRIDKIIDQIGKIADTEDCYNV